MFQDGGPAGNGDECCSGLMTFPEGRGFLGVRLCLSPRNGNGDISIEKTPIPQKVLSPVTGHFFEIWRGQGHMSVPLTAHDTFKKRKEMLL